MSTLLERTQKLPHMGRKQRGTQPQMLILSTPSSFLLHARMKRNGERGRGGSIDFCFIVLEKKPVFSVKSVPELLISSFNFDAFLSLENYKFLSERGPARLHLLHPHPHTNTHVRPSVFHLLAPPPSSLACVGVCVCVCEIGGDTERHRGRIRSCNESCWQCD